MTDPANTPDRSTSPRRRLISKRDISIEIFEGPDGLMLVCATFLDPYHLIRLDLTVDPASKRIIAAAAEMANHPHTLCPLVIVKAQALVGLTVGRGVMKEISHRIGGPQGCVHLRELSMEAVNFIATAIVGYDYGYGVMSRDFNVMPEAERYRLEKDPLRGTCQIFQGGDQPGPPGHTGDAGT